MLNQANHSLARHKQDKRVEKTVQERNKNGSYECSQVPRVVATLEAKMYNSKIPHGNHVKSIGLSFLRL
ncbi:hypothetical protein [Bartonella queenslandensis]|uniref:hypothetical protein n=1 Tax=Bartonella queenslandensis TaxID=481138 RepID=UPI000308E01C|nr:hypothetical protein [Bartonella queenslandensis]